MLIWKYFLIWGRKRPEKLFSSTIVKIVGTLNIFATFARPSALLIRICPSIDLTANAICG
jgi:hypothetical protein